MNDLDIRIARLEAESQIRKLIARYSFDIDDRLLDRMRELFAEDAIVRSADGVMYAQGVDAIMDMYRARFEVLGPGHHFMHDVQIDFTGDGSAAATGRVSGHAELQRNGRMFLAALRYADRYCSTAQGWKFAEREISFLYYVPVESYREILLTRDRNMAYGEARPADFPEKLESWRAYERSIGRA